MTAVWMVLAATIDPSPALPMSPDDQTAPVPRDPTPLLLLAGAGLVLGFALLVRQIEVVTWTARPRRLVPAAPRRQPAPG